MPLKTRYLTLIRTKKLNAYKRSKKTVNVKLEQNKVFVSVKKKYTEHWRDTCVIVTRNANYTNARRP